MKGKFIVLTEVYENGGFFKYSSVPSEEQNTVFTSSGTGHSLRKILINTDHITMVKDYPNFVERLKDGDPWHEDLIEGQGFTRVYLSSGSTSTSSATNIVVLGNLELITSKILEASGQK
jgi:hypothetical protein